MPNLIGQSGVLSLPSRHILVAEDEAGLADSVRAYLEHEGFRVTLAGDGHEALALAGSVAPDLLVLDVRMPGLNGFDVLRAIRRESTLPVLLLTARVEDADKLLGLELGADDYITKPFNSRELVARIRAVLRRSTGELTPTEVLTAGPLTIHLTSAEVTLSERRIPLTPTEFRLLAALARKPGRILSRVQLLEAALDTYYEGYERSIDTHISNLRRKLQEEPDGPQYVETVYGRGYKLNV